MPRQKINRIGETKIMNRGEIATIIEYKNARNIVVRFENGDEVECRYEHFANGKVTSRLYRSVYGVGYIGIGKYNVKDIIHGQNPYCYWTNIIGRCYDEKYQKKAPSYKGCKVYSEWHNFQNFAKWFEDNYYDCNDEKMCVDKDILHKGNKIYSPENCIFVPQRINNLFVKCDKARGNYPIGVYYVAKNNNFQSSCKVFNNTKSKKIHLGTFNTSDKAFNEYKKFKESYIKQVAEEYSSKIPFKLYEAMYRYIVEIDD